MVRIRRFGRSLRPMFCMLLVGVMWRSCIPMPLDLVGVQSRIWQIQLGHILWFVVFGRRAYDTTIARGVVLGRLVYVQRLRRL